MLDPCDARTRLPYGVKLDQRLVLDVRDLFKGRGKQQPRDRHEMRDERGRQHAVPQLKWRELEALVGER